MAPFSIVSIVLLQFIVNVRCEVSPSVIIVGAGPAGIAAASRLVENNITNIKILEAEGRIGGRINSVKFGDAIIDLGAQWCHGENNNVVYEIIKDLDLVEPSDWSQTFYHSSGEYIDQKFANELQELFDNISGQIEYPEGLSMGDYVISQYNKSISDRYENNPEKLKFASEFLSVLEKGILLSDGTFSWFDVAANSDFEESTGSQGFNWKGRGFKTLLDVLLKKYPNPENELPINDKIILNKEVIKIVWDDNIENGASVECLDNSVYKADHVILTVSLGVLKDRYHTLFYPSLPQEKVDAIEELGIAAVAKVFFHFPQRWWLIDNFKTVTLFWSENDKLQLEKNDQSWLLDLFQFFPVEKNPNVLEVWFAGEFVPEIELFSDGKIVDGAMFVLNKFLGGQFPNISIPDAILRSSWYTNPHFKGTYSYQTIKSRKREISGEVALSKPLTSSNGKQTLLFAGEATNPTHYATVHGAVETGFREADRIISIYN